jgi:hypothetical protein
MNEIINKLEETAYNQIERYFSHLPYEYKWRQMFDNNDELNEGLAIDYILDNYSEEIVDLIMDELDSVFNFSSQRFNFYQSNLEYIAQNRERFDDK